jgi:5-methyltetrahydropteroyltriglutamate--homocysteine methyltransferase
LTFCCNFECSYWKGGITEAEFLSTAEEVQCNSWKAQKSAGIELIGLDGTNYDQILDMAATLGLVPQRFSHLQGLECYFAMARGVAESTALDMSKYLNTNYHYLVRIINNRVNFQTSLEIACYSCNRAVV